MESFSFKHKHFVPADRTEGGKFNDIRYCVGEQFLDSSGLDDLEKVGKDYVIGRWMNDKVDGKSSYYKVFHDDNFMLILTNTFSEYFL